MGATKHTEPMKTLGKNAEFWLPQAEITFQ